MSLSARPLQLEPCGACAASPPTQTARLMPTGIRSETCPEAHSCDATCELPCAGGAEVIDQGDGSGSAGHRLLRFLAEM